MAGGTSYKEDNLALPSKEHSKKSTRHSSTQLYLIIAVVEFLVIVVLTAVLIILSRIYFSPSPHLADDSGGLNPSSVTNLKAAGPYKHGVVAADNGKCSEIGRDMMKIRHGSAVDAAIATLFCLGVMNMHSSGIGGSGSMVIYNRTTNLASVFDFRATAPAAANETMYINSNLSALFGASAVAVPGEIKGYLAVWRKYGRLPWRVLVQPAIDLAWQGVPIGKNMYEAMMEFHELLTKSDSLKALLQGENGELRKLGEIVKVPKLAKTLERIRDDPESFYTGDLAKDIVSDVEEGGGLITLEDMKNYNVIVKAPQTSTLKEYTWYSTPPPGCGPVLHLIINILKGYNMTSANRKDDEQSILTYHRAIEAFKYAYAHRALLADPDFTNMSLALRTLTDPVLAEELRQKIVDNQTFTDFKHYGKDVSLVADGGTTHVSVLDQYGNAVAVTTTINKKFGSMFVGRKTGIILNDSMNNFSKPGKRTMYELEPSVPNYIRPGKRPLSSSAQSIFVDKDNNVKLVVGASGGFKIPSAIAQVVMNFFWFGRNISESITDPRVHHVLIPMQTLLENGYFMPQPIIDGLKRIGHVVALANGTSVVQAVTRIGKGELYGKSDPKKGGWAAGF